MNNSEDRITHKEALTKMLDALRLPCDRWNKTQTIKVQEAIKAGEEALMSVSGVAQPEQFKPLTDAEFAEQWHKQTGRIMGTDKSLLLQVKQVTEAAHGIKE